MFTRVLVLVGPSGSGKTAIINQIVATHPSMVAVRSFTTRPCRGPGDTGYEFITAGEFEARRAAGLVVQFDRFRGNIYGNDRSHFEAVSGNIGILAMTAKGAQSLLALPYDVRVVNIVAVGNDAHRPGREDEDESLLRAENPDFVLYNRFVKNGLNTATCELVRYACGAFQ
jgi:guanylate kinase